ncbi:hypothetical protein KKC45_02210 [Patescibacteria group bacterium]|nr:hypothetical protein [Patescibacteria group bacterium]
MEEKIIQALNNINQNLDSINQNIESSKNFWDTQWFATIIGVLIAFFVAWLKEVTTSRSERLTKIYNFLVRDKHHLKPDSILSIASMTSYGSTMHKKGIETKIPEKSISEKMVIQLRRRYKYWQFPKSYLSYLFFKYEKSINELSDGKEAEIEVTAEYEEVVKCFQKINDLIEKKTGENEWTAR